MQLQLFGGNGNSSSGKRSSGSSGKNNKNVQNQVDEFKADMKQYEFDGNKSVWDRDKERAQIYSKYQEGTANKDNFFYNTYGEFDLIQDRPDRPADYVSRDRNGKVSSEYWYTDGGVIRGSKHWGSGVASCDWYLNGARMKKDGLTNMSTKKYGFIKWNDFVHKTQEIYIDGKSYLSTFKNTIGKEQVKINGSEYWYNVYKLQWIKPR